MMPLRLLQQAPKRSVLPEFRQRKVGRRLMEAAIEFARDTMKVDLIGLSVIGSQQSAKNLYLSLGFVNWGTEPRAMRIGDQYYDEDYMTLILLPNDLQT